MNKQNLLLLLGLYLVSAAMSFGAFSYWRQKPSSARSVPTAEEAGETLLSQLLEIDPNEPQDQECPLNGAWHTQIEREAWEQRRPLAVMIENHPEARPQSGLSTADIVFEAVAEGGVTRFMGMFYCGVQRFDTTLAPVRSARTYFIDWASGFNRPLYVHVGGANLSGPTDALGQLSEYGWRGENDLDQFGIGYPTFVRDYNRLEGKEIATEHTMVSSTEKLWEVGVDRGWTNTSPERKLGLKVVGGDNWWDNFESWEFETEPSEAGDVSQIKYDFWSGYNEYSIRWAYNPEADAYDRYMGGEVHVDLNDDHQIQAKNVIVLLTTEKGPINEKKHMLYGTTGTGDALIFNHGQVTKATWEKEERTDQLQFVNSRGRKVPLARGLTWISVVNLVTEVEY